MNHEKVYAICENMCWEETLTKEQILALTGNTGWVDCEKNVNIDTLRVRKMGSLCRLECASDTQINITGQQITLGTAPEGFRPIQTVHFWGFLSGTRLMRLAVTPEGNIIIDWAINIKDATYFTGNTWVEASTQYFVD